MIADGRLVSPRAGRRRLQRDGAFGPSDPVSAGMGAAGMLAQFKAQPMGALSVTHTLVQNSDVSVGPAQHKKAYILMVDSRSSPSGVPIFGALDRGTAFAWFGVDFDYDGTNIIDGRTTLENHENYAGGWFGSEAMVTFYAQARSPLNPAQTPAPPAPPAKGKGSKAPPSKPPPPPPPLREVVVWFDGINNPPGGRKCDFTGRFRVRGNGEVIVDYCQLQGGGSGSPDADSGTALVANRKGTQHALAYSGWHPQDILDT